MSGERHSQLLLLQDSLIHLKDYRVMENIKHDYTSQIF